MDESSLSHTRWKCQYHIVIAECPNAQLKEIKERTGCRDPRMVGTIAVFMNSKTVVSPHEHSQNSLEIFQLSRKTSTSPRQCRNIMAQISVDTLHREGVTLVVNIEDMISGKNDI